MFLSENKIKCSLLAMSSICKWLDDLDEDRHPDRPEEEKISAHLAQANTEKRLVTPEKYGPAERIVKFEQPGTGYQYDNQSARGRSQYRGAYRGGGRGGAGRGRGYENYGGGRGNNNTQYRSPNSPGQDFQAGNNRPDTQYRGDSSPRIQQSVQFRDNGNQGGGRNNHSNDYQNGDRQDKYRSPQQQQYRRENEGTPERKEHTNTQSPNNYSNNYNRNTYQNPSPNNQGTSTGNERNRGGRDSPVNQSLTYKLGFDGNPGWFLGDMRIPDPPRIGQQEIMAYQQSIIDRKLNEALSNSRYNSARTSIVNVPISANFAVLDDNLIDENVYFNEPTCLFDYIYEMLARFMWFYSTNLSRFNAIDFLGAYFDLIETRDESMEARISEDAMNWHMNKFPTRSNNDIQCFMVHVTATQNSTTSNSSTADTRPTNSNTTLSAAETTPAVTPASNFEGDMSSESIMAALAFLQKAQNANALKEMTTAQKMMIRSVTETLSDQAHEILLDERGKNKTAEAVVSEVLDEAVLSVNIRGYAERREEENKNRDGKTDTDAVTSLSKSDKISSDKDDTSLNKKETSISIIDAKGPTLTEILNDLNNVRMPPADRNEEIRIDNTSPNKRASERVKIAKDKEDTLRMHEEDSKECDALVNAIINNLDRVEDPPVTLTSTATSTETVWIRTKPKSKVVTTNTRIAPANPSVTTVSIA